jgi:hypothetical protein
LSRHDWINHDSQCELAARSLGRSPRPQVKRFPWKPGGCETPWSPIGTGLSLSATMLGDKDECKSGAGHRRSHRSLSITGPPVIPALSATPRMNRSASRQRDVNDAAGGAGSPHAMKAPVYASPEPTQKTLYWSDTVGQFVDAVAPEAARDRSARHGGSAVEDETLEASSGAISRMLAATEPPPLPRSALSPELSPAFEIWGYKLVAKVGQRYFSLWAGESAEYGLGKPMEEEALPDRRGGLYICDSAASAARQYISTTFAGDELCVAMLRCACRGPFVDYGGGKAACSVLTPCGEVPLPAERGATTVPGLWHRLAATHKPGGAHSDERGRMSTMPGWEIVGYACVARMGRPPMRERHFSLWAKDAFRFELGVTARDESLTDQSRDHLWVVSSPDEAPSVRIMIAENLRSSGIGQATRVLLRCVCEGPFVEMADGRVACSKLTPLDEVRMEVCEEQQEPEYVPMPPQLPRPARAKPRGRVSGVMRPQTPKRQRPASAPFHGRRTQFH